MSLTAELNYDLIKLESDQNYWREYKWPPLKGNGDDTIGEWISYKRGDGQSARCCLMPIFSVHYSSLTSSGLEYQRDTRGK